MTARGTGEAMWYLRVSVRAFSTVVLSAILFVILGGNQYAYEHAAIFLESASGRSHAEALTVIIVCGFYLSVLAWTLTATIASALVEAHDVGTRQRLAYVLLLSFCAGVFPLIGVLRTLYKVRHAYLSTPATLELASFSWYALLAVLLMFPLGAALSVLYIHRYGRFPRLFRSKSFLIALLIPVAVAFVSIYVGAFISAGGQIFGSKGTLFPSQYLGLPSLVARFGFITYLVVFVTMFVLLTRIIQREGREFRQSVVVILIGCGILAYLVKPSGTYPVALYTDKSTQAYLEQHDVARQSDAYRKTYRKIYNKVRAAQEVGEDVQDAKLPVMDPSLSVDAVLRARGIPALPQAFAEWLKKRVAGRDAAGARASCHGHRFGRQLCARRGHEFPVFIVAAEGGGYYAAYHSALTLARLQDLCPDFRNQIFAISGVSGGSLGASIFAAISDNIPADFRQHPCGSPTSGRYEPVVKEFFSQDLLSPLLTTFLYIDLPAALLPLPNSLLPFSIPYNRVTALETSFEDAFDKAKEAGWINPLREPFFARWDPSRATPALVLNGTLIWRSTPFLVGQVFFSGKTLDKALDLQVSHNLRRKLEDQFQMNMAAIIEDPDKKKYAYDELEKQLGEEPTRRILGGQEYFDSLHLLEFAPDVNLKLSSAVAISARAPYVTPSALVSGKALASQEQMRLGKTIQVVDGGYWDNSGIRTALDLVAELEAAQPEWKVPGVHVAFYILSFGDLTSDLGSSGLDEAKGSPEILAPLDTMMEVRGRAQQGSWFSLVRARKDPVRFTLFDVKFSAPLDWSASAVTRTSIEQRSGYPRLSLRDEDRPVCCNKRGDYYPNWSSEGQIVSLLQTTWSAAGAREACGQTGGALDPTIDGCTKLIGNNPSDATAYKNRANAYASKGDYDRAIADARELIKLDPRAADYYDFSARLYLAKGNTKDAIDEMSKAIELEPRRAAYYEERSTARLKAGDYVNALVDDEATVELYSFEETSTKGQPGEATARALGNVAWSAVLAQSFDKALNSAKRAVSLDPDLLLLKVNLAHALLFSGQTPKAKEIYLAHKGEPTQDNKLWETVIHEDFEEFRTVGLDHLAGPAMADIETALGVQSP